MTSEFYLVLPSNSSMVTHPNNTLAQYITNLPRRISLFGDWECGLTEIHYPHDWHNVRNARLTVEHDGNVETDVCFEDGYYDNPKALATTLNGDKPGRVKFSYEPVTQKVVAHVKGDTKVALYGDLPDILGFMQGDPVTVLTSSARSRIVRAYSIVDLRRGFESLYVYSSIVEPRIVGDKIAPLLRIVPITGSHGEMVTARFDHVQYIPVLSREFGCVETEIRDDTGRPVPFERGKVRVTFTFDGAAPGYSDELRRLLCEAGGWGTALFYRRSCPEGARVWKFVQWSPPNGCPSDQKRCCRFGEACADDWSADCWRCRGW